MLPVPLIDPIPTLPKDYHYLKTSHTSLEPMRGQGCSHPLQAVTQGPTFRKTSQVG